MHHLVDSYGHYGIKPRYLGPILVLQGTSLHFLVYFSIFDLPLGLETSDVANCAENPLLKHAAQLATSNVTFPRGLSP
jgi:hypothetical protein